jgi:hypothetical protein
MQVKQEEQEKSNAIAFDFDVFDFVDIEKNVSVDLSEAKQHTEHF